MNKAIKISTIFTFFVLFVFAFAGCNGKSDDKIVGIYIQADSYQTAVQKNSNYNTTNVLVYAKYANTEDVLIDGAKVTFSTIDTSTVGQKTLTASIDVNGTTITSDPVLVTVYGELESVNLKENTFKTKVFDDELDAYNTATIVATANYEGNYSVDVAAQNLEITFDKNNVQTDAQGKDYIALSVTYQGMTTTEKVFVYENKIIELFALNVPSELRKNEVIDFSTIQVTGKRTDEEIFTLTKGEENGYEINLDFNTTTAGEKALTFIYMKDVNISKTFYVKVYGAVQNVLIDKTTVPTTVNVNGEYNTSDIKVSVTYEGLDLHDVPLQKTFINDENVVFSNINTQATGDQILTATCENVVSTNSVIVHVISPIRIAGITQDENYGKYLSNSQNQNTYISSKSAGNPGFATTGNPYWVGTDNAFKYLPIANGFDITTGEPTENTQFLADIKVEQLQNDTYVDVTDDTTLVSFDDYTHEFWFTQNAEGSQFKITIQNGTHSQSAEVKITNGYNVYTTQQLSVFDNVNAGKKWNELKTENNLLDVVANKLILHSDLTLQMGRDIPNSYLWSTTDAQEPGIAGALKNFDTGYGSHAIYAANSDSDNQIYGIIYRRMVEEGSSFTFEGNYFTIDASNIPLAISNSDSVLPEHDPENEQLLGMVSLFGCEAARQDIQATTQSVYINNTHFVGNAQKDDQTGDNKDYPKNAGGIIAFKNRNIKSYFTNNFTQRFYISFMIRGMDPTISPLTSIDGSELQSEAVFDGITTFDAYNSLLYLQGAGKVEINNSVLIGAGGPAIIADHAYGDKDETDILKGRPTYIYKSNTILESYVMGTEPWFVANNAQPLIAILRALQERLKVAGYDYGHTIGQTANMMNAQIVMKDDTLKFTREIRGAIVDLDEKEALGDDYAPYYAGSAQHTASVIKEIERVFRNYFKVTPVSNENQTTIYDYLNAVGQTLNPQIENLAEQVISGYAANYDGLASAILPQIPSGNTFVSSEESWVYIPIAPTPVPVSFDLTQFGIGTYTPDNYSMYLGPDASVIGTTPPSELYIYFPPTYGLGVMLGGFFYIEA